MGEKDDGSKAVTRIVIGGVGAAAGAMIGDPVSGAVLGSTLSSGLEVAVEAFGKFRAQRADAWWREYIRILGTLTPEGAITEAALRADQDPAFNERIFHSLNAVWAAVDEAVLPLLAFLSADYHARGKPIDIFFKRCARFLQETTRAHFINA